MHVDLMFPSKYVKCADLLGKSVVATIASVKLDTIQTVDGAKSKKAVVTLKGAEKAWIMNKTCAKVIKKAYGAETNGWIGKRIELYPTTCEAFGEIVDCVRVRIPTNGKAAKTPTATVSAETPHDPLTGEVEEPIPDGLDTPLTPEEKARYAEIGGPPMDEPETQDREPGADA